MESGWDFQETIENPRVHGEMQEVFSTFEVRIQEEGDGDFQKKKKDWKYHKSKAFRKETKENLLGGEGKI